MSVFTNVELGPPVVIFALNKACLDDKFPKKVNLTIGAYRTEEGKPWVLPVVRKVKKLISEDEALNHEYLPVLGLELCSSTATRMLLGNDSKAIHEERAFGIQSLSGTGALRIGAAFLHNILNRSTVYVSDPTWENHNLLFRHAGFKDIRSYQYWDPINRNINFDGMCSDLRNAPEGSVIVLHACAHNPTGCDPTHDQWKIIADIISEKKLFPFMDCAYQGFATSNLENDSWSVRYFADQGLELFCAQSFAKNFGLYNERIGNLTCILKSRELVPAVKSQFTLLVRGMYSNPPAFGARIVSTILNNPQYFAEWQNCIEIMSSRIIKVREGLRSRLERLNTPGSWKHITDQIGMFSYTGLSAKQVDCLVKEYHIYLPKTGRISMCGLNEQNLDYVAEAIYNAVTRITEPSNPV